MSAIQELDFSVNLLRAILWQYNDAKRLQSILSQKQDWYETNQSRFWRDWCRDVFNLQTANDFGLSVWGIILGESRDVAVEGMPVEYPAFGFGRHRKNFNNGNFRRSRDSYQRLSTSQYRLLIRLKYYKLISRGTVPEINHYMRLLFGGRGKVYVADPLDMSYAYFIFSFEPESWQHFVLEDMDALPRPAGVGAKIVVYRRRCFGFGRHHDNFSGTFAESARL